MIYLDNNATTKVRPEVREALLPHLGEAYGNPAAGYRFGKAARGAVDAARGQLARLVGAEPAEIVFTSCGTESNNTAIRSAMDCFPERRHFVSTRAEHSAVFKPLTHLEEHHGYEVTWVAVDREGRIDAEEVGAAIRPGETALVSIMWANNETGVLAPVAEIAKLCAEAGTLFHTDAVQAAGKVPVNAREAGVHLLSVSGHKFHAPKGVGALFVSEKVRFAPLLRGGGQENDRRSGTENVAGIVGMGKAAELAARQLEAGVPAEIGALRDRFEKAVLGGVTGCERNGHAEERLSNTSNLYFEGVDAEGMLILLDGKEVYCSPGSACSTGAVEPSRVIVAMGHDRERARSSVRFSLSAENTVEEIDEAARVVIEACGKLRIARPGGSGRVIMHS